jgi:uncharacterized membrane protein
MGNSVIALDFPCALAVSISKTCGITSHSTIAEEFRSSVRRDSATDGGWKTCREGFVMTVSTRSGISENTAGSIAYFTFIPAILLLLISPYKNSDSIRFHAWQSVLLSIAAFSFEILSGIVAVLLILTNTQMLLLVMRILSWLWLLVWLVCVLRALNGKRFKIPLLGNIAERLSMK